MMTREQILAEIARTAAANSGVALGVTRFQQETGIATSDWLGKYWARWGDAVKEAGCVPSEWQQPLEGRVLLDSYARLIRELGYIPVKAELQLKAKRSPGFPSNKAFGRFGTKAQLVARAAAYCRETPGFEDVLAIALAAETKPSAVPLPSESSQEVAGYVYLLRANRYFKIGRSISFNRRSRELAIQLPEIAETVHVIHTDDAVGIEAYWHRRFESKRKNGEWFELAAQDVKAFKRRKFM